MGEIGSESLEELKKCYYVLVDTEMENRRYIIFIFAMNIFDAHMSSRKLKTAFEKLKCAANLNVAIAFVLKKVEAGIFRYYFGQETNTLIERSLLVATTNDLVKIKIVLSNTDVIEACTKERANTKWKVYKLTNVTVFAVLLKKFPWGLRTQYCQSELQKTTLIIL